MCVRVCVSPSASVSVPSAKSPFFFSFRRPCRGLARHRSTRDRVRGRQEVGVSCNYPITKFHKLPFHRSLESTFRLPPIPTCAVGGADRVAKQRRSGK